MARPLRIQYDGALYHVTSNGNAGRPIFKDDRDRNLFLSILEKVNDRYNWICHAYCLMTNHYHLVIETPDGNLSKGMRQLNGVYTQAYNRRHRRSGHILQGRYKAILIQKETHLLEVCRYVVLNPVRARAAPRPEQWQWSSYRCTAGLRVPRPCLTTDWVLGQFGRHRRQAERRYREFVRGGIYGKPVWGSLKAQSILGEEGFAERLVPYMRRTRGLKEIPRRQRHVGRPTLGALFTQKVLGDKGARNKGIREAVEEHGYDQKEVADHLGMHYSTISRLINEK